MHYLFILLLSLMPLSAAWSEPVIVGSTAPDWTLNNKDGKPVEYYKDSENNVSVILFWATWCPYCATLMPHLEVIYRKYRNKGVKVYAVDIFEDGKINPIEHFAAKEYTYTLLLEGDEVAKQYTVKGTPGLFVIDKDKKVIYRKPAGVSDVLVSQNIDLKLKQATSK